MRIWTLWAYKDGVEKPGIYGSITEHELSTFDMPVEVSLTEYVRQLRLEYADQPEIGRWFTRAIEVADASIINGSTGATSIVGAVVGGKNDSSPR